jgi:hypothetical protein
MSYNNSFTLSIKENKQLVARLHCTNCDISFQNKFCPECGYETVIKEFPIDDVELISTFRESDLCDDYCHLINDNGSSEESCGGDGFEDAIAEFSKEYPEVIFQLDVDWDSGFGEPPSRYYIKNGEEQDCKVKIIFEECKL